MSNSAMSVPAADSASMHEFPWKWYLRDLKIPDDARTVFSCFACGGGSTMGYKLAGYRVIGCCEIDQAMIKLYRQNHHPKISFCTDVRNLVTMDLPAELYDLDVLDGSPPCSVFSMAGKREEGWGKEKRFREGQEKQRLDDLFFAFLDVANRLRPKVVVAENVAGLLRGNAKGYVNEIIKAFDAAGYYVQMFLLNAAVMGVPQDRERVFFIGRRKDLNLPAVRFTFNERPINFGDVRSAEGRPIAGKAAEALRHRVPSDNDLSDCQKRVRRKAVGFTAPINSDCRPAYTITSGGCAYRMCDGLGMTDEDVINCQTFPQDYDFLDQSVQYVCGMSVPPVMMAHIAGEIKKQIFGG